MNYVMRNETAADEHAVESLTKRAFWNVYVPGCCEHYLVHQLRKSQDFIPELDFVLELDGVIVANVMYAKSYLLNAEDERQEVLTLGPFSVDPAFQNKGLGSMLVRHSIEKAGELKYPLILLYGHPTRYCRYGFKGAYTMGIGSPDGKYPSSLMVKSLRELPASTAALRYFESPAYEVDLSKSEDFDKDFEPLEKKYCYTQEEFSIMSHSFVIP